MSNMQNIKDDDWKETLHSEIITSLTGSFEEKRRATIQVGMYYQCSAPASLYKYYGDSLKRLDTVKDNKMWYSAPCNFNDVFDCEITVDEKAIMNDALKMIPGNIPVRPGSRAWKSVHETMKRELRSFRSTFEKLRYTMGVACLSESDTSLLMWAHYADNHRGMCVEYDLMEINNQLNFTPVPVVYSDDRVCFNTLNPDTAKNDSLSFFIRSITSKSRDWSYEREWRIIREDTACGERWNKDKNGALLDMICPSSIILGCAVTAEFENAVRKYCEDYKINLYKMEKDREQYQLNKKAVIMFDS